MWLAVLKLLLFIYLTTFTSVLVFGYHTGDLRHKTEYVTSKWRERPQFKNQIAVTTENNLQGPSAVVRVRHSRFPNLDSFLNKLDGMHDTSTKRPARFAAAITKHTTTTSSDGLLDDYEDDLNYDDDDMEEDAIDKENQDEFTDDDRLLNDEQDLKDQDNVDYEEDDPVLEDNYDDEEEDRNAQIEERHQIQAPSSLTEYKWKHYGTRSKVEESRRHQLHLQSGNTNFDAARAVVEHTVRVNSEGRCKKPSPKVIPVQNEYPDPGKTYIPHCTILHRCGEDTGCCNNYATRCAAKKQTLVHLYFYTSTLGIPGNKVERLPFYNHTECACIEKSKIGQIANTTVENLRQFKSGISVRSTNHPNRLSPENIRRCKCPKQYLPRLRSDMSCFCDCAEANYDCQRIKKGKEHFSLLDRGCILRKECGSPNCEYGAYLRQTGRCPRKQEKIEAYGKIRS